MEENSNCLIRQSPFKVGYDQDLDISSGLSSDTASYYLTVIGILRWMIELGRIDIITEVSLLPSHIALPRVMVHVDQKYNSWCMIPCIQM